MGQILDSTIETTDYDKILSAQIYSDAPNHDIIKNCVDNGADISVDFLYNIIWLDMDQPKMIYNRENGKVTVETIKLLIELGADVKWHDEDEADCLLMAIWTWMPDLVKLLLEHGANPNGIQEGESILDCAYDELTYVWHEKVGADNEMGQIVELIKLNGGKRTEELMEK